MPRTDVVIYSEEDGKVPVLEWMDGLPQKAQDKCIVKIERLADMGHELRRPEADYLTDGIYELRVSHRRIQHRILYFFHESVAVLVHGITKESAVPPRDIQVAMARRTSYCENPESHIYKG